MNMQPQKKKQYLTSSTSKHTDAFEHININIAHAETLTFGDRLADSIANSIGSWNFIIIQSCIMVLWFIINTIAFIAHFDPYPFIFLNLAMSMEAAYSAPVIMMSQNRQAAKDRIAAEHDYEVNVRAEQDIMTVLKRLDEQDKILEQKINMVLATIDNKTKGAAQ